MRTAHRHRRSGCKDIRDGRSSAARRHIRRRRRRSSRAGCRFVFPVTDCRRVDKALAHEGQAAGRIGQPGTGNHAEPSTQGAGEIDLIENLRIRRAHVCGDGIAVDIIGKRHVGLEAEQHPGWELKVITGLQAADRSAEAVADACGRRIAQGRVGVTAAVAGMGAEVESGPVHDRLQPGRLDGHSRRDVCGPCRAAEHDRAERASNPEALHEWIQGVERAHACVISDFACPETSVGQWRWAWSAQQMRARVIRLACRIAQLPQTPAEPNQCLATIPKYKCN